MANEEKKLNKSAESARQKGGNKKEEPHKNDAGVAKKGGLKKDNGAEDRHTEEKKSIGGAQTEKEQRAGEEGCRERKG